MNAVALATSERPVVADATVSSKAAWVGRVLSALALMFLTFDTVIHVFMLPVAVEATKDLGFPDRAVQVSLDFADLDDMTQKFAALAESGTVTVPLQDTFWGAKFGMLTDPFGVRWMFNCAVPER